MRVDLTPLNVSLFVFKFTFLTYIWNTLAGVSTLKKKHFIAPKINTTYVCVMTVFKGAAKRTRRPQGLQLNFFEVAFPLQQI